MCDFEKRSIDEAPEADMMDIDAIIGAMSPEERNEYLTWCSERADAAREYQMQQDAHGETSTEVK